MSLREDVAVMVNTAIGETSGATADWDTALGYADMILSIPAIREALETHEMVVAMEGWGKSTAPCKGPDQRL